MGPKSSLLRMRQDRWWEFGAPTQNAMGSAVQQLPSGRVTGKSDGCCKGEVTAYVGDPTTPRQ